MFAHLGVLVYKHQGVRHVVVAEVYDRGPHPVANLPLTLIENAVHGFGHSWRLLHPIQALHASIMAASNHAIMHSVAHAFTHSPMDASMQAFKQSTRQWFS